MGIVIDTGIPVERMEPPAMVEAVDPNEWTEDRWGSESRAGAEVTRQIMEKSRPRIELFGNGHRSGWPEHPDDLNNYPLKFMNMWLARHASGTPRVRTQSFRGPALGPIAEAIKDFSNAWAVEAKFGDTNRKLCWDGAMDFGVCCYTLEPYEDPQGAQYLRQLGFEADDVADRLKCYQVIPNRYVQDSRTLDPDLCEWAGHFEVYTVEDAKAMLAEYGATPEEVEAVGQLAGGAADELRQDINAYIGERVDSDEVVILHAWRRRTKKMYFLGVRSTTDAAPKLLTKPIDYHGPENGPYVVMGVRWVRGSGLPVSPLAATDKTLEESNAHRGQMRDDARSAKQLVRVNNQSDADTINNSPNASAVVIGDDSPNSGDVIKVGGVNEENVVASQMCDRELDAITGISAAAQGELGKSSNATEVAESSSRQNMREETEKQMWRSRLAECFRRVTWYFINTPTMRQHITSIDPKTGEKRNRLAIGGEQGNGIEVEDLGIDIIPYSHEFVNEQQMRDNFQRMGESLVMKLQLAQQFPVGINYAEWWRRENDMMNYGDGVGDIVDWAAITQQAMVAQQVMAMAAATPEGGGEPKQKPAADVTQQTRSGAAQLGAQNRRAG
jgi:hypothetical protein